MIKEIEAVLFIPATPGSEMRKLLQSAEDQGAKLMSSPSIRVVERAGTKLINEVGSNNPWKKEWMCPRKNCLPCKGQAILGAEAEQDAVNLVIGDREEEKEELKVNKWPKDDTRSLPGCTSEGCNYVIECLQCRKQGLKRRYYG